MSVQQTADVFRHRYLASDRELFQQHLADFVPPEAFDAHAHLYDLAHFGTNPHGPVAEEGASDGKPGNQRTRVSHDVLIERMSRWMGDSVVRAGLYFPMPHASLDIRAANRLMAEERRKKPDACRTLMLVRPSDDPESVEATLKDDQFDGFKVYHVYAQGPNAGAGSFDAAPEEFIPEWTWELADQRGLVIMLHLVRQHAPCDETNQRYILDRCRRFPNAKLVLAHAARGFNARHTVDGIKSLRGISNVWFDTSAICESSAFEAIIDAFGVTRLMYGSDFPVSELRGRCISVGDGFYWLHDHNADWAASNFATPQLVGIESLFALRQACHRMKLIDRDIESIFHENARHMLNFDRGSDSRETTLRQYQDAKRIIPGGTQLLSKRPEMFAPDQWPAYFEQAIGCEVTDTAGRSFVDMSHCGILSCILGYADPDVNAAVIRRVQLGQMSTQQTYDEVELAELLLELHPWARHARFSRTGGEAMTIAVRVARAATSKTKIVVCGYHGWHDWYLAANHLPSGEGQSLDKHLLPGLEPKGVPFELSGTVGTFSYNQIDELDQTLARCGDDIAAIVMEPTRSVDPAPGFLESVRARADQVGAVLIFDEISSAWRYHLGGIHLRYEVEPDIAVFAKAMSNGFAMSALIGRDHPMQACHDSFISSTSWTEGIGPAAALATIRKLQKTDAPQRLHELGTQVQQGWRRLSDKHQLPIKIGGRPASTMLSFDHPENLALQTLLTTRMLDRGYLSSGTCSLTLAHQPHHIENYLDALDGVFHELATAIRLGDIHTRLRGSVRHTGFLRLVD